MKWARVGTPRALPEHVNRVGMDTIFRSATAHNRIGVEAKL